MTGDERITRLERELEILRQEIADLRRRLVAPEQRSGGR
jgi:hypothetical protein